MKKIKIGNAVVFVLLFAITLLGINACKKSNSSEGDQNTASRKLSVYLTDAPCNYDSVFIDIRYVEVKIDTSKEHMHDDHYGDNDMDDDDHHNHHDKYGKWDTVNIVPGVYNIMTLRNGVDTLLGTVDLPEGTIRKIRITLGSNHRVVTGGASFTLNQFPGANNYVYVKIKREHEDYNGNGRSSLWLDFNVCRSIVFANGKYYIKPFIMPFGRNQTGSIEGKVLPADAWPVVMAFNSTDTANALPDRESGRYKIRGLKNGTYSLLFQSSNGYKDTTITNVSVSKGSQTTVPLVTLRK